LITVMNRNRRSGRLAGKASLGAAMRRLGGSQAGKVTASMQDRFLATTRVNGPNDPPTTTKDVVVEKRLSFRIPLAVIGVSTVTSDTISAQLPNVTGLTFRIQKLSVYDDATTGSSIELNDLTSDLASFRDYGTAGSIRPQVHITPALEVRQRWFVKGTPVSIYTILRGSAIAGTGVAVVTVEMRLPVNSGT